jgi:hypothetical protein
MWHEPSPSIEVLSPDRREAARHIVTSRCDRLRKHADAAGSNTEKTQGKDQDDLEIQRSGPVRLQRPGREAARALVPAALA